jgi:MscS family membrane protein
MIPGHFISSLPQFLKTTFFEQPLWKWLSMLLVTALGMGIAMLVFRWTRRTVSQKVDQRISKSFFRKMLFPLCLVVISKLLEYFLDEQINITGTVQTIIIFADEIVFLVAMVWVVNIVGNAMAEYFIAKPSVHSGSIDANMLRIISRIVTIAVVFVLLLKVSSDLGVSLTPIFASAGIVGLALALAARETVANFFGGLNILLDRPFKVGDYVILDSGERGEVVDVGLRSTRIITRDDVQVSVPNSKITDAKIINESVPMNRFRVRIKIGVAYGSDIDQVEELLLQTAKSNSLITLYPEPRVRFRKFGDSALEFELLCWAYKPDVKGKLMHELHRDIYKSFNASGISIPYPQRDVHLIKEDDGTSATDEV